MSVAYFGSGKVKNQTEVLFDRFGLATGSITLQYPYTTAFTVGLGGAIGARHPDFAFLHVEKKRMRRAAAWIWVTLEYVGIEGVRTDSIWETDGGMNTEPIETHRKFTELAGTPGNAIGGAKFDPDGQFLGFSHTQQPGNLSPVSGGSGDHEAYSAGFIADMAGVQSYLNPGGAITERYMTSRAPRIAGIGTIVELPKSCTIELKITGSNFLLGNPKITQRAKVWDVTIPYLQSGSRGWNKHLYGGSGGVIG